MPEPVAISNDHILERLRTRFGFDADAVEFMPLGYDADAWVYRVHARNGDRFLKIRRGPVNEAGLVMPQLLTARGIPHLIAPIPTAAGASFDGGDPAFILFPFVEGESGGQLGMSAAQWSELGATIRAIHDLPPDGEFATILRSEDFVPAKIGMLREVEERIHWVSTAATPPGSSWPTSSVRTANNSNGSSLGPRGWRLSRGIARVRPSSAMRICTHGTSWSRPTATSSSSTGTARCSRRANAI